MSFAMLIGTIHDRVTHISTETVTDTVCILLPFLVDILMNKGVFIPSIVQFSSKKQENGIVSVDGKSK